MFGNMTVAFVGSGTMGEAIIKAVLNKELVTPEQIIASDIRPDRGTELAARYGVRVTTNNVVAAGQGDVVILAVKPQVLPIMLDELKNKISPTALVLSIVAGARIATLVKGLEHEAVVRSMPNTPAQIGEGMVVWTAVDAVSEKQREQATAILQSMGQAIYVHEEKQLDMATAVNGSGPAYVFLFMEAMIDAAVRLGFSWAVARQLVLQTVLGSVLYARQTDVHLAELRNQVTTPAGTTAEALHQLEKGALRVVVNEAIQAAYQQSRRLAGGD